ncbi:MAG TPA: carboxypeptidase-like regulatory domain-containing protein [Vicinamibacterales bacterium]|nr:carboxypeptidase-like regulatory domain-containing protein [Vicinamibacterales bacterium]
MKAVLALVPIVLLAQQRDTTPPPVPVGSGEIAGRVVSADSNPQPLRRTVVTLTGDLLNPRSVLTNDDGRFVFSRLPAGTFSVTARKAAYLAAPYGARRPGRAGMPIALAEGQRLSISIAMFRGSAITGVLRDRSGTPVRGVDVRAIDARTILVEDALPPEIATTDDRGVYRIYGLRPGDYYVVALPMMGGSGEITAPSAASVDAALALLSSRRPVAPGGKPAPPPSPPRQPTVGFAPVVYPGTASHSEAASVRVEAGEERTGVDFEMRLFRMAAIEGVVSGDVPNLAAVQVSIMPSGPRVQTMLYSGSVSGRAIDAQGHFRYSNLSPGRYRVVARAQRGDVTSSTPTIVSGVRIGGGGGAGEPPRPSTGDYLYGVADVELQGEDAANVALALQPGGTMSGRITFGGTGATAVPADLSRMRVSVSLQGALGSVSADGVTMGTGLLSSQIATVRPDGTFEVRGIGPGRFTLTVSFPSTAEAGAWKLRSATVGGRNVLDDVLELGPGIDLRDVAVKFSDEVTQLSGTLQGVSGQLITEYYIVAIPTDRSMWRPRARRIQSVRPATDGRFVFTDLLAGEYVLAALTDLDPIDLWSTAVLTQIAAAGAPVTVADGEKKVHDLRIR